MAEQVAIHEDRHIGRMAERRHASDCIPSGRSSSLRIGLRHGLSGNGSEPFLIQTVRSADQHHHRSATRDEDQRLHDLFDLTTDSSRGIDRGPGALRELPDTDTDA